MSEHLAPKTRKTTKPTPKAGKAVEPTTDHRPLIVVPGFMASNLWRVPRGLLNPPLLAWPLNIYSLAVQLYLLKYEYPMRPDGLVEGYYEGLLDFLNRSPEKNGLGYVLNQNLWVFAYDWRQSCHLSGQQLTAFITEKLAKVNTARSETGLAAWDSVDIINHSMGGFVTRSAMVEFGAPVKRCIYIASGHYGTAKAFFALHPHTGTRLVDDFVNGFIPGWYWELLKTLPQIWLLEGC